MTPISFPREHTQILKGIALLLMLVTHTCTPSYWAESGSTAFILWENLQSATKMCVYIFAFLVGYGFFCSQNKTLRYSAKRIVLLCIPFWAMLFCLFIPSAYISGKLPEVLGYGSEGGGNLWLLELVYNMFGISESLNWYSWFVCFYILSILSLPFLHKFYTKYPRWGWLISIMGYYVAECALHTLPHWDTNPLLHNLFTYTSIIPLVIVGYQCAVWNSEGRLPHWFEGEKRLPLALATIIVVLFIKSADIPSLGFCLQAFYTPFFVFAVVGIFNSFKLPVLTSALTKVGNLSMYMWFFHAIFFTKTVNRYSRDLVMEPIHNYFYTFLMTFVLTYIGSWIVKRLLSPVINKIK